MARSSTPRMGKQWDTLLPTIFGFTANATVGGSRIDAATSLTILRMIGEYVITPTGVIVAGDQARICMAIGIVSTDAASLGATALPDPGDEPDYPWLYWREHAFHFGAAASGTAGEGAQGAGGSVRESFDIRSMRRMKPRESLTWVFQYVNGVGLPPLQMFAAGPRVLTGLH